MKEVVRTDATEGVGEERVGLVVDIVGAEQVARVGQLCGRVEEERQRVKRRHDLVEHRLDLIRVEALACDQDAAAAQTAFSDVVPEPQ